MKLFISSDIEGTAGICTWDETEPGSKLYEYFSAQMTREVRGACRGAQEAGVQEIVVKDAHDTARNIIPEELPEGVRILRGWTGGPASMMAGLDASFGAAAMTGYHSGCAVNGNPLSHTMNLQNEYIKINGELASEFRINAYYAGYLGVPVVFVSGDKALCESARAICPNITAVAVSEGMGGASLSLQPAEAVKRIRAGMAEALRKDVSQCRVVLPASFQVEVRYREHKAALRNSFYPGAKAVDDKTVVFSSGDYMDVLKFFMFCL